MMTLHCFALLRLFPVLTTLACGGQADKEALDAETKGEKTTEHQPVAP